MRAYIQANSHDEEKKQAMDTVDTIPPDLLALACQKINIASRIALMATHRRALCATLLMTKPILKINLCEFFEGKYDPLLSILGSFSTSNKPFVLRLAFYKSDEEESRSPRLITQMDELESMRQKVWVKLGRLKLHKAINIKSIHVDDVMLFLATLEERNHTNHSNHSSHSISEAKMEDMIFTVEHTSSRKTVMNVLTSTPLANLTHLDIRFTRIVWQTGITIVNTATRAPEGWDSISTFAPNLQVLKVAFPSDRGHLFVESLFLSPIAKCQNLRDLTIHGNNIRGEMIATAFDPEHQAALTNLTLILPQDDLVSIWRGRDEGYMPQNTISRLEQIVLITHDEQTFDKVSESSLTRVRTTVDPTKRKALYVFDTHENGTHIGLLYALSKHLTDFTIRHVDGINFSFLDTQQELLLETDDVNDFAISLASGLCTCNSLNFKYDASLEFGAGLEDAHHLSTLHQLIYTHLMSRSTTTLSIQKVSLLMVLNGTHDSRLIELSTQYVLAHSASKRIELSSNFHGASAAVREWRRVQTLFNNVDVEHVNITIDTQYRGNEDDLRSLKKFMMEWLKKTRTIPDAKLRSITATMSHRTIVHDRFSYHVADNEQGYVYSAKFCPL